MRNANMDTTSGYGDSQFITHYKLQKLHQTTTAPATASVAAAASGQVLSL